GRIRTSNLLIQSQLRYHCATAHSYIHYSGQRSAISRRLTADRSRLLRIDRDVMARQVVLGGVTARGDAACDHGVDAAIGIERDRGRADRFPSRLLEAQGAHGGTR